MCQRAPDAGHGLSSVPTQGPSISSSKSSSGGISGQTLPSQELECTLSRAAAVTSAAFVPNSSGVTSIPHLLHTPWLMVHASVGGMYGAPVHMRKYK